MAEKSKTCLPAGRKKILYVITKSVWGGAGKYVYDLATNLPKDEFAVYVAAGERDELAKKIIEAKIPYFEIKSFQRDINILKEIFAYFEILLLLLKIRPDIIHVNSSKAGGIVGIAIWDYRILNFLNPKSYKIKTIFTAHGWAFHESRPKWQILLIKLFTKITCFYYSKIICVSEFDRLSALKNHIAPARKLITVHNGINTEEYGFLPREEAHQRLGLATPELVVATIGEFTKNKGQEYLIKAAQKLLRVQSLNQRLKFKILIIGWGEKLSNLKSEILNLGLKDDVLLIENLAEPAKYLKAFDIFVLPSLKEGLPYTLLEAGLAGLPVVATNVGGIPEIIGHEQGILVEPTETDALAEKIRELANNPEKRAQMGTNLWHKIVSEFSLEKMLNFTLEIYK